MPWAHHSAAGSLLNHLLLAGLLHDGRDSVEHLLRELRRLEERQKSRLVQRAFSSGLGRIAIVRTNVAAQSPRVTVKTLAAFFV